VILGWLFQIEINYLVSGSDIETSKLATSQQNNGNQIKISTFTWLLPILFNNFFILSTLLSLF